MRRKSSELTQEEARKHGECGFKDIPKFANESKSLKHDDFAKLL